MRYCDFADESENAFSPHLGHAMYLDGEKISLQFEIKKAKGKDGLEKGRIQYLSVGFRHAHKTTKPEIATK